MYLDKCCCFDLRTGSIIIGWLNIFTSLIVLVIDLVLFNSRESELAFADDENIQNLSPETKRLLLIGVLIAFILINIVGSGLVIYGSMKKRRFYLVPWICFESLSLGFTSIFLLGCLASPTTRPLTILTGLTIFGIRIYSFLCIYSYYQYLKDQETEMPVTEIIVPRQSPIHTVVVVESQEEKPPPPYSSLFN